MDNIIPLAPDKLEGHEDDGVTTILCLGDDPFSLKLDADETIKLSEQVCLYESAAVFSSMHYAIHYAGGSKMKQ